MKRRWACCIVRGLRLAWRQQGQAGVQPLCASRAAGRRWRKPASVALRTRSSRILKWDLGPSGSDMTNLVGGRGLSVLPPGPTACHQSIQSMNMGFHVFRQAWYARKYFFVNSIVALYKFVAYVAPCGLRCLGYLGPGQAVAYATKSVEG